MERSARLVSPPRAAPLDVLRAPQWAHFVALPLAGFAPAAGWSRLPVGCALAALALAYAYGLNAISDRRTDLDGRKNPLAGRTDLPGSAAPLVGGCGAGALLCGLGLGPPAAAACAVSLLAATVYSAGPRWKAVPGVGTLLNAAIFVPLLLVAAAGVAAGGLALEVVVFSALLLQNQLLHEESDAAEDAAAGSRTTARAIGSAGVRWIAAALGLSGAVAAAAAGPGRAVFAAALAALAAGTLVALGRGPAAARRLAHRWAAFAGGALLFAAARLG